MLLCWGMILPIKVRRGTREIQRLEICVDFGTICGIDPRKGAPTLIWICHDRLTSCSGLGRLSWGRSKSTLAKQIWSASWKTVCGFEVGPSACRLQPGRGFCDIQPLLIYDVVTNIGPPQPLLIYRHLSFASMMPVCMYMSVFH